MKKSKYILLFIVSFIIMMIVQLPDIISYGGYFIYSGDYNYQHIVFSAHAFDLIKSGRVLYDFTNAMGTDVLSSFAHIIITPFFMIGLLLPSKGVLVLLLPVLTALKTALASLTASAYIGRYVKKDIPIIIGSLLYAFSGFQSFSLVFGSFHDITPWFPLMLYFLDEFFEEDKKGRFALIVMFSAASNSFFFYGQVVFVILYFIVKSVTKEYKVTLKKFMGLAAESIIGVLLSGILLYPGVITLSGNSRVGEFIHGMDMVSYQDRSIVLRIIQSIFMMPDVCSSTTLFSGDNTWTSMSLYLPVTGSIFVISYIIKNKKKWDSVLVLLSLIISVVPVFNSMFFMFNSSYYARWFYMPVLVMALVTAREIERCNVKDYKSGICFSGIVLGIFALIACLPGEKENVETKLNGIKKIAFMEFPEDKLLFWRTLGFAGLFVLLIYLLISKYRDEKTFWRKLLLLVVSGIVILNIIYIKDVDEIDKGYSKNISAGVLKCPEILNEDEDFFRIDGQILNANLYWDIPGVDDFVTTSSEGLNSFYDEFNIFRAQKTCMDSRYYPIWSLFSCKYYLNQSSGDDLNVEYVQLKTEGFEKTKVEPCYHIYSNTNFIPMGFCYNQYITKSELEKYVEKYALEHPDHDKTSESVKDENYMIEVLNNLTKPKEFSFDEKYFQKMCVLLKAVVISDDDVQDVTGYMKELKADDIEEIDYETFVSDCSDRKSMSCSEFKTNNTGFTAEITSDNKKIVFFSIPYDKGWTAVVNGKEADVKRANYGFMAVEIQKGDNTIEFSYKNRNYYTGAVISIIGVVLYIVYCIVNYMIRRKNKSEKK